LKLSTCLAATVAFSVLTLPVHADEGKTTTIHIVFQSYYERVRPTYASGNVVEKLDVAFSGGSNILETLNSSNALANRTFVTGQTLGGKWHVAGPHRLIGTENLSQSTRTTVIDVNGKSCSASWTARLKPGFQEYNVYSIQLSTYAFYKQTRMVSATCEIE
jgi:hypothetical protein